MTPDLAPLILQTSNVYNLRSDLLAAQIQCESGGDPFAFRFEPEFWRNYIRGNVKAKAGQYGPLAACSFGLLQILLETACEIGFTDRPERLFDAKIGIAWGAKYLRNLLDWAGEDYERALAAYNGGKEGNIVRPFRNSAYAARVFAVSGDVTLMAKGNTVGEVKT